MTAVLITDKPQRIHGVIMMTLCDRCGAVWAASLCLGDRNGKLVCLFYSFKLLKSNIDVGTMYSSNTSPKMHWPYECEDPFYR